MIAGLNLLVANHPDEVEILKEEITERLQSALSSIKLKDRGVFVQASTLGSLEALLEFLRTSKIPYAGVKIGPVVKRDVMKASVMLEHDEKYAVILAFDVKVSNPKFFMNLLINFVVLQIERDAQDLADKEGVRIFQADIIYHLFDRFTQHLDELKKQKREEFKHIAVFPCKLKIVPNNVFKTRDPIVAGVKVEAGVLQAGTPICVPSKGVSKWNWLVCFAILTFVCFSVLGHWNRDKYSIQPQRSRQGSQGRGDLRQNRADPGGISKNGRSPFRRE